MSKVLVDTNVWVDIVLNRPQFVEASKGAIMACLEDGDEMIIAATSLKDVFYFASKSAGSDSGYRAIELIIDVAAPAQIDAVVCRNALTLEKPDYEDGIIAACALAEEAEVIITRDEHAFSDLGAAKYSPDEFLKARGFSPIDL